jgi:hypothetical protein
VVHCVLHEVAEMRNPKLYYLRVTFILDDGHIAVCPFKYIKVLPIYDLEARQS